MMRHTTLKHREIMIDGMVESISSENSQSGTAKLSGN